MWYKKIVLGADDREIDDETKEYVKDQVGTLRKAEDTFHEILRKEKQKASKRHKTAHPVAFPKELVNVLEFKSFEDTYKKNNGLVMFVRSPPCYTRASRILDFYEFKAGEFSSVVMKFNDDSVTRIHGDIVIGIKVEDWGGLENMYRSGEKVKKRRTSKRRASKRRGSKRRRSGEKVKKGSNKRKATVSTVTKRKAKKRARKRNA